MTRKCVGLALSGGVVRGFAHMGVLAVLEEAGIPIDMVSGTSVGAIVAVCLAAGWPAERMMAFGRRWSWATIMRPVWPVRGLVSFAGLEKSLRAELGDVRLENLSMPCAVTVTNLEESCTVSLQSGPAAQAVHASCSVPGFVAPVQINGCWCGEGGMADMLPAQVLHRMGAEMVIGVDIFSPGLRKRLGPLGYFIDGLETALQHSGGGVLHADCLISPRLGGQTYLRFSQRERLYALGRQAALEKLPDIRRALDL